MKINTIDASLCARMFLAGAKNLEAKKEWINELNVFPVPDGDTGTNMTHAKIYTTLFPCNECTKALIQAGISEVIYLCDKYAETPSVIAAKRMMKSAGVRYTPYHPANKKIQLDL